MRSPKDPYRVAISFNKALEFGTEDSYNTKTQDGARHIAETRARECKCGAHVRIYHNTAGYPKFDWQLVDEYDIDKNGSLI